MNKELQNYGFISRSQTTTIKSIWDFHPAESEFGIGGPNFDPSFSLHLMTDDIFISQLKMPSRDKKYHEDCLPQLCLFIVHEKNIKAVRNK